MVDVLSNAYLLTNILQAQYTLCLNCNTATVHIALVRDITGYGTVWFHPEVIADILYLMRVKNLYRVTYDSSKINYFTVYKGNGGTIKFTDYPIGLYWINTKDSDITYGTTMINIYDKYSSQFISYIDTAPINTVEDKRFSYT